MFKLQLLNSTKQTNRIKYHHKIFKIEGHFMRKDKS